MLPSELKFQRRSLQKWLLMIRAAVAWLATCKVVKERYSCTYRMSSTSLSIFSLLSHLFSYFLSILHLLSAYSKFAALLLLSSPFSASFRLFSSLSSQVSFFFLSSSSSFFTLFFSSFFALTAHTTVHTRVTKIMRAWIVPGQKMALARLKVSITISCNKIGCVGIVWETFR